MVRVMIHRYSGRSYIFDVSMVTTAKSGESSVVILSLPSGDVSQYRPHRVVRRVRQFTQGCVTTPEMGLFDYE